MILPAEHDAALDALIDARELVATTIDELERLQGAGTAHVLAVYRQAHDATAWCVEHIKQATVTTRQLAVQDAAEVRHIEAQMFPWVDDL